jgi:pilus assembly protein Flp/PilA
MRKLLNAVQGFCRDEEGAALVEYAVLLGVMLGVTILVITTLGTSISGKFQAANDAINP